MPSGTQSLPDAARALGISHETGRKQIRAVFNKTGVARRSELVGGLASSAGLDR